MSQPQHAIDSPDFPPHDQLGRSALLRDGVSGFLDLGRSDVAEKSHKQP